MLISKVVLSIICDDTQSAAGSIQLCVGKISGVEAAARVMQLAFHKEENEAILLANAFIKLRSCPTCCTKIMSMFCNHSY